MHAEEPTKLSLYEWARIIGVNPLHFAGIDASPDSFPHCAQPWTQYEWQAGDRVGREAVARSINMAEAMIEEYTHWHLLPAYDVDERHPARQFWQPELRGRFVANKYQTNFRKVIAGGTRATSVIEAAAAVAYATSGYWRRGTVTTTVAAGQDPEEVRLYYPGKGPDPTWEIRPIEISISGTTATITFPQECAVDEDLWNALEFVAADPADDTDFLATVDVYRVYTDPAAQISFRWEPTSLCGCGEDGCPNCSFQTQTGCLYVRDFNPDLGIIAARPGTWADGVFTAGEYSYGRAPDGAALSYFSGLVDNQLGLSTRTMQRTMAQAVAYFAAALLERPPCDCVVDSWEYWRQDAAAGTDARYAVQVPRGATTNPFGTRQGAVYAWRRVNERNDVFEDAVLAR